MVGNEKMSRTTNQEAVPGPIMDTTRVRDNPTNKLLIRWLSQCPIKFYGIDNTVPLIQLRSVVLVTAKDLCLGYLLLLVSVNAPSSIKDIVISYCLMHYRLSVAGGSTAFYCERINSIC